MNQIKVLVIKPDSSITEETISNHFKSFQKIVEGYIECVIQRDDGLCLYVNEDVRDRFPKNLLATGFVKQHNPTAWLLDDSIFGNAVFTKVNLEGESENLTPSQLQELKDFFGF